MIYSPKTCFVAFCALGILFLGREGSKKQNGNVVIWFLGRSNITAQREFLLWKHSTWTQRNCYIGDWKDDLPEWFPFFTFLYLGQLELVVDKLPAQLTLLISVNFDCHASTEVWVILIQTRALHLFQKSCQKWSMMGILAKRKRENRERKKEKNMEKNENKIFVVQVVMEVHPLLGQLDCLLAGEEAKRGENIIKLFAFL